MTLTKKQQIVLANALAWCEGWCEERWEPTQEEIADFFAHNDRGLPTRTLGGHKIQAGWTAHYGNPFGWIEGFEKGKDNPPAIPPAAWIYEAYFWKGWGWSGWAGWANILLDFIHDAVVYGHNWQRMLPAYTLAYKLSAFHHSPLGVREALITCGLLGDKERYPLT